MEAIVLGAGGALGRHVCAELTARGHHAVGWRRGEEIGRADLIVNCAGASMTLGLGKGWRGYGAVDVPIGRKAVEAAKRHGARLVYVAVHHPPALRACAYIDAHERVAAAMRELGGDACVVRATGFHSIFASFLPMARRGWLVDVGAGRTRTNPISERDLAAVVADAAVGGGERELSAGGPEVMTRAEVFEAVAAAAGRKVRVVRAPVWMGRAGAAALRLVHPRLGQLAHFGTLLARHDVVAPAVGRTRLSDYLAEAAAQR